MLRKMIILGVVGTSLMMVVSDINRNGTELDTFFLVMSEIRTGILDIKNRHRKPVVS